MASYDLIAEHYDAVTGDPASEVAFIDTTIRRGHRRPTTLLEVACGTGSIIAPLADRYQVSGLDISASMLALARQKLPAGTPLYLADMSSFRLDTKFDAIICVYHGINHLLDFSAWEGFFDCARRHLSDDGVLAFDVLTADNAKAMADSPRIVQEFGANYLVLRLRTADDIVFDWNMEVFVHQQGGSYERLEEVIQTASFSIAQTRAALRARFTDVEIIESDGGLSADSDSRTWFVCSK